MGKLKIHGKLCVILCFILLSGQLMGAATFPRVLTAEEEEIIQDQLTYTVGYSNATIPISYNLHGTLTGVSIEMMRDFSDWASILFEFVDMDDPTNANMQVDMNLKMDNYSTLALSDPFMTVPMILVQESHVEGQLRTIGVMDSLGLIDPISSVDHAEIIEYTDFNKLKQAVLEKKIDGMVISSLRFPNIATEVDEYKLKTTLLDEVLEYNIYFSEGFPQEKIDIFNKLIQSYGELRIDYLVAKHSNYAIATMSTFEMINENFDIIFISFFVGISSVTCIVVFYQVKQRKKLILQMEYDELTGLFSERKFIKETKLLLQNKKEQLYTLLVFDIDNFKYINEIYGYERGSKILQELAFTIKEVVPPETPVSRSYGDNFLLLLNEEQTRKITHIKVEDFKVVGEHLRSILGKEYDFNFSLGLYTIKDASEDVSLMIDSATFARDKGKGTLGITVHTYNETMTQERANNNMVSVTMQEALQHHEFVVYYQPKFDLKTQETNGAEALVRWFRSGKMVPPNDFIPIFEKNGFIEKLDYYVLETVCIFVRDHELENVPKISVNLSGITVMQHDLVLRIQEVLRRTGVSPYQIDLEITESAFVDSFHTAVSKLEQLRELGFTISMDDFGAGLSSLNRLKSIPLDILKIDREFIVDSLENEKGRAIIKNVIHMAKDLGLDTVAEGIETQEQLELLRDLGCNVGQGYVYSRPLPSEDFLTKIT